MFIHITKEKVLSVMLDYLYLSYYSEHGLILLKTNSNYYYLFPSFCKCNIFGTVSKMFYNLFLLGNKICLSFNERFQLACFSVF